jgi:membrane fusion protein, adhesin transport system
MGTPMTEHSPPPPATVTATESGTQPAPAMQMIDPAIACSRFVPEHRDVKSAQSVIRLSGASLAVFLGWAALTPIHELTIAQGSIMPEGFIQQVQHLEGGIVDKVLVDDGARIMAGDPILELDTLAIKADLAKARTRMEALRLQAERLAAFAEGRVSTLETSKGHEALLASQQGAGLYRDNLREARAMVLRADIEARIAEMKGVEGKIDSSQRELTLVSARAAEYQRGAAIGFISKREAENVQRDKIRLEGDVANLKSQYATLLARINESRARETEQRAQFASEALDDLSKITTERAETASLVAQLEDRLERATLRAPVSGVIQSIAVRGGGRVLKPGELVAEIVPEQQNVFAQVEIPAEKIGYITPGMPAAVKVSAYDYARFGAVEGEVDRISPSNMKTEDHRTVFIARIKLSSGFVGSKEAGRPVTPGMTVTADIRSGHKTALTYLFKPVYALTDRALTER